MAYVHAVSHRFRPRGCGSLVPRAATSAARADRDADVPQSAPFASRAFTIQDRDAHNAQGFPTMHRMLMVRGHDGQGQGVARRTLTVTLELDRRPREWRPNKWRANPRTTVHGSTKTPRSSCIWDPRRPREWGKIKSPKMACQSTVHGRTQKLRSPSFAFAREGQPFPRQSHDDHVKEEQSSPPRWPLRKAPRPRRTHRRELSRLRDRPQLPSFG